MRSGRRHGFTLIELLVVVAIIGLLLSILLPSLSKAREQGRIAVCLSNLKSIGQAAAGYWQENQGFIFTAHALGNRRECMQFAQPTIRLFTEFIWGGGVPDRRSRDWDPDFLGPINPIRGRFAPADVYVIPPERRPLNRYMFPEWSEPQRVVYNAERRQVPYNPPGVFRCPSDWHAAVPDAGGQNPRRETDTIFRSWEWWGNSYPINWYWLHYYEQAPPGNRPPYSGQNQILKILGADCSIPGLGTKMLLEKEQRGASEFILFYENSMNYPIASARPRGYISEPDNFDYLGWHKAIDTHAAAFFDGHAAYRKFDTRYVDGPGWTTWPNRPWRGVWEQYNDN